MLWKPCVMRWRTWCEFRGKDCPERLWWCTGPNSGHIQDFRWKCDDALFCSRFAKLYSVSSTTAGLQAKNYHSFCSLSGRRQDTRENSSQTRAGKSTNNSAAATKLDQEKLKVRKGKHFAWNQAPVCLECADGDQFLVEIKRWPESVLILTRQRWNDCHFSLFCTQRITRRINSKTT